MNVQGPEGMIFAGKYKINKLIGRGGMANVYLGTDMGSGIKVAIKILKPEFSTDEEFIRRFDTEAKAVSSLNHANIVKVFGVGHEGNFRYIVQEYIDGITVKELINQNGHLDWKVAVPIVIQVGMALEYAHKNGIVHRDIKPQNILISRERIAKITDFGIARASTGSTITMTSGGAMGSVHYFSPEQARGGNVGPSSDIYSIGIMLFEMVTGRVPFDGDSNVAIAVKHLQEKPAMASSFIPDIPAGLDSIILKCMQKTPDKRYSSMRQMVTELDALMVDPTGVYGIVNNEMAEPEQEPQNVSFRQDPNYEKIGELEKSAEARRRSRFRDNIILVLIIVAIVGVLVGIGTIVVRSLRNATNIQANVDYTVKDYRGMTAAEAKAELEANNIEYEIVNVETDDVDPNVVIDQSIDPGTVIRSGSTLPTHRVVLSVSVATGAFQLGDYQGTDYHVAYTSLVSQGLRVSPLAEENDEYEPGTVIRTQPEAGSTVIEGDSVVLVYAQEPSSSTVPDLTGMTLEAARQALEDEGLTVSSVEGSPDVTTLPESSQYVIMTDPAAGVLLTRGAAVHIYVGTWEDVQRGGTPTPTPVPVTVTAQVSGDGWVEGLGAYSPGGQCIIVAHANPGWTFSHWLDPYGNPVWYDPTFQFTIRDAVPGEETITISYTAVFVADPTPTPLPTPTPTPVPETTPYTDPWTQPTDPQPPYPGDPGQDPWGGQQPGGY
ncbi:MAG: Stk1 family PASTA domain-containing Ser/Thr kinase [Saccharofermentans sp.]|nr:Stk1 family PASTA domain-containing Ser/Thr kinase [Saccharofermentans sp.]